MIVDADFESGNIEFLGLGENGAARLRLKSDPKLNYKQWFYFSIAQTDRPIELIIENAGDALVPAGWVDYQAFRSRDRRQWVRTSTTYRDGKLIIAHTPSREPTFYAYFPPYDAANLTALMRRCADDSRVNIGELCATGAGGAVTLLETVGACADPLHIWILCRQHPGEVQASWWVDGFLRELLHHNARSAEFLQRARFFIVPNMNPDGSALGHHRTSSLGINLNASWDKADPRTSPPVFHVLRHMHASAMDFCLDVHADEELPHAFAARVDLLVPIAPALARIRGNFERRLAAINANFKIDGGYVRPHTVAAPLSFCGPHLMKVFDAPALTLELPYKMIPDDDGGQRDFGAEDATRMGRSCLQALWEILPDIEQHKRQKTAAKVEA